jgi:RimJ/RimL family protein N-acetyltransferase
MDGLTIRAATSSDRASIKHNINQICREGIYLVPSQFIMPRRWRDILRAGGERDRDLIIVAEVGGTVVGHGRAFTTPGTCAHVADVGLALIAGYRDRGIGSRMVVHVIDWARSHDLRKLTLGVFASNARARHVYEKFGFVVEGVLVDQHLIQGAYVDEILMATFL